MRYRLAAYVVSSVPDREARVPRGRHILGLDPFNVVTHPVGDRRKEGAHLIVRPLRDQFHFPARQVAHVSRDRVTSCDTLRGVAEADSLHPAGVMDAFANRPHRPTPGYQEVVRSPPAAGSVR